MIAGFPGIKSTGLDTDQIGNATSNVLKMYAAGRNFADQDHQNYLKFAVGGRMAEGDTQGAQQTAFRGGDIKMGTDISNWDVDRRTKALNLITEGAKRADTPAKWSQLVSTVEGMFGPAMVAQYRDFNARPNALTVLEQAELKLRQDADKRAAAQLDLNRAADRRAAAMHEQQVRLTTAQANEAENPILKYRRAEKLGLAMGLEGDDLKRFVLTGGQYDAGSRFTVVDQDKLLFDNKTKQWVPVPGAQSGESKAFKEARDKKLGDQQAEAIATLPTVTTTASEALTILEQIRDHPGRYWGTGATTWTGRIPNTDAMGFKKLVEQAKGGAFLQAVQALRGSGAISEKEGETATASVARMETAQNQRDFDQALADYERVIRNGVADAHRRARGDFSGRPIPQPKDRTKPGGGASAERRGLQPQPAAIAYLRANPHLAPQFDAKYGPGAAASILGR